MKQLTAFLLILSFLLSLAGCSAAGAARALDAAENRFEEKLDAAEDAAEASVRDEMVQRLLAGKNACKRFDIHMISPYI